MEETVYLLDLFSRYQPEQPLREAFTGARIRHAQIDSKARHVAGATGICPEGSGRHLQTAPHGSMAWAMWRCIPGSRASSWATRRLPT